MNKYGGVTCDEMTQRCMAFANAIKLGNSLNINKENGMEDKLTYKFEYTNEFGCTTKYEQEVTSDTFEFDSDLDVMIIQFKQFLLASGYSNELVSKIAFNE